MFLGKGEEFEIMDRLAYTVKEAAEALGLSKSKLYELVQANEVPHAKVGGKVLLPRKELEEWFQAQVVLPQKKVLKIARR